MHQMAFLVSVVVILAAVSGCSKQPPVSSSAKEQTVSPQAVVPTTGFSPFFVYQDKGSKNRFTPSGYMPTGDCLNLDDGWQYDVKEGRTCTRIVYDIPCSKEGRQWGGIYWQNPADNWGNRKGGYNLTGATKLVFWAKGELGGERIEEFKIGGLGVNQIYPDSDTASIGPVILSNEWKEYTIDVRGKDLSYISGGFAWVANVAANPYHCTFYLDHIRFE